MAVKFPLEMKDGNKVRTIEEFRTYFDSEKAVMYLDNDCGCTLAA